MKEVLEMSVIWKREVNLPPLALLLTIVVLGCSALRLSPSSPQETASYLKGRKPIMLRKLRVFEGFHKGFFSSDGARLALMNIDHIDIVEVATGRQLCRIAQPNSLFLHAAFSPDGQLLATAYISERGEKSELKKVTLWDSVTGDEVRTLMISVEPFSWRIERLSFSDDGKLLGANANGGRIWEVTTGRELYRAPNPEKTFGALLSPNGKWLVTYVESRTLPDHYGAVHVLELATKRETVLATDVLRDWAFSRDSSLLATTATTDKETIAERAVAEVWEMGSWRRLQVIETPRSWQGAFALSFSPDRKMLAVGGRRKFGLFSLQTGELLAEATHPDANFKAQSQLYLDLSHIEFSPDGKLLLTGGNDGTVKLWRIEE